MALKIVWDFQIGDIGWSETYYTNGIDPTTYITLSNNGQLQACPALTFFTLRKELLVTSASILRVRASIPGSPRFCMIAEMPANANQGQWASTYAPLSPIRVADRTYTKLLVRWSSGFTRVRSQWIGGIPSIVVATPNTYNPSALWNTALGNWASALITGGYGLIGRPTPTTNPPAVPITAFTTSPTANAVTMLPIVQPGPPNPPSWYVVIRGVKYPKGWNGVHRAQIQTVGGVPTLILGPTRKAYLSAPPWDPFAQGTVQLVPTTPLFFAFNSFTADRIEQRKVGRPFGQPLGRARSLSAG
jgi:hypothetical protein